MSDTSALRGIIIQQGVDTIFSKILNIAEGVSNVSLNVVLQPGSYYISTDSKVNMASLGVTSPRLKIAEKEDVQFPYVESNLMSINNSNFGESNYFYFFDWQIEPYFEPCLSAITPIHFDLDTTTSYFNVEKSIQLFTMFPNPVSDFLNVHIHDSYEKLVLLDIYGRVIIEYENDLELMTNTIDVSMLNSGVYILKMSNAYQEQLVKMIKK